MSAAYDKWLKSLSPPAPAYPGYDIVEEAFEAGVKHGLSVDRFEPAEDDYDPKREELLKLASSLAVGVLTQGSAVRVTDVPSITSVAAAIIAEVDRVIWVKL